MPRAGSAHRAISLNEQRYEVADRRPVEAGVLLLNNSADRGPDPSAGRSPQVFGALGMPLMPGCWPGGTAGAGGALTPGVNRLPPLGLMLLSVERAGAALCSMATTWWWSSSATALDCRCQRSTSPPAAPASVGVRAQRTTAAAATVRG